MKHWNAPLQIIALVKEIGTTYNWVQSNHLSYDGWLERLSKHVFNQDDTVIQSFLQRGFDILQDPKMNYHILYLEGHLKVEEDEKLSLHEKYLQLASTPLMNDLRQQYKNDINKRRNLFMACIENTAHMQTGDFLVMKYGKAVSFFDLWNEFYMETRGVVIDLRHVELVSAAYPKFFNYNEKVITMPNAIVNRLKWADRVFIRNKEDGSMIAVSKHRDSIFVSTPGSLQSDQAIWTKAFLENRYPDFLQNLPEGLTFIFETIYPQNRIVIDYKGQEKVVLTGIRNTVTGQLLSQNDVELYAAQFQFETPDLESKSFDQIVADSKNSELYPGTEKEGWVVICEKGTETFLFKIKCDEYCQIHRLIVDATNVRYLLPLLQNDTFDDFIAKVPSSLQQNVRDIVDKIFLFAKDKEKAIQLAYASIPSDFLFTKEEVSNNDRLKSLVEQLVEEQGDSKLSKTILGEMKQNLISRASGKLISGDKWTMKELERLWTLIPSELQNQKVYQQKNGRLLGFINKNVAESERAYVLKKARFEPFDILQELSFRDVRHLEVSQEALTE